MILAGKITRLELSTYLSAYSIKFTSTRQGLKSVNACHPSTIRSTLQEVKDTIIKIINIIPSSGLLLKYDPGVPLVYTSFAIILIGGSLSIISTKKIWVLHEKENSMIYIGGLSNRNLSGLSKEMPSLISFLEN